MHPFRMGPRRQIRMHHTALNRTGSHDSNLHHQIIKTAGPQTRQHAHLGPAFNLKHAHRIGPANHVVGGAVIRGNVLQTQGIAAPRTDQCQTTPNGRQHAQGQNIDLEQTHRIQIVFIPLNHAALGHGRVLDRHQARQRTIGQHKTPYMLAQVARKTQQLHRQLHPQSQPARGRHYHVRPQTLYRSRQALLQNFAPIHTRMLLAQSIHQSLWNFQCTPDIAQGTARPVTGHNGRQRRPLTPVFGINILNHLFASLMLKININVGRFITLATDKSLKQQMRMDRIHLGHPQAITHH